MRRTLVTLHRWFGLFTAIFLFLAGATGAIISWDHELDEWLNPHLFHAAVTDNPLPPLELVSRLEAADPRLQARFYPLANESGHSFVVFVEPRIDPVTQQPFALGFNQVALDPATGDILGKREWGKIALDRENLLPFLYKLHFSMHIPDAFGLRLGILFMGIVAIVWVIDTLVALWISFPNRSTWRQSFLFRWKAGGYRLQFDLHRSGGVWIYPLVLMLAVTSVAMNLKEEVMRPVVGWFSPLTPSPLAGRASASVKGPTEPAIRVEAVLAKAEAEARRRGWTEPLGGVFLSSLSGVYGVGFYQPGNSHGDVGLGNNWLYYDLNNGDLVGAELPGQGSAGDIFLQSMLPLHSGRIIGIPGRILMSITGVLISMLSVTGIIIWARKRKAKVAKQERPEPTPVLRGAESAQAR